MWRVIRARLKQGHRTIGYPASEHALPDRFRGRPVVDHGKCPAGCHDCADACPTDAITLDDAGVALDLGRCLFCTECVAACPEANLLHARSFLACANVVPVAREVDPVPGLLERPRCGCGARLRGASQKPFVERLQR